METRAQLAQVDAIEAFLASHPNLGKGVVQHLNAQLAAQQTNLDIADTVAWAARRAGQAVSVAPEPPQIPANGLAVADARERSRAHVSLPALPTVTPRADAVDKTDNAAKRYGIPTGYEVSVSRLSSGLSNHEVPVLVPAGKGYSGQDGTVWGVINQMTFAPSYKAFAFSVLNRAACRKGRPMPDMGTLEDVMSESRLLAYDELFGEKADGLLFNEGIYPVYAEVTELSDLTVSSARLAGRQARRAARQAGRQAGRPTRAARLATRAARAARLAGWHGAPVAPLKARAARAARKARQAARTNRTNREMWESKRTFATYTLNGIEGWYINRIARCMTCPTCITYEDKPRSKYLIGACETPMDIWEYVTVSRQIMRSLHKAAERALTGEKWKAQAIVAQRAADAEIADMAVESDSPVGDLVELIAQVCGILGKPVTVPGGMSREAANVLAVAFGLETTATGRRVAIARLKGMASV